MPSLEFVQECIGRPKDIKTKHCVLFQFGLEFENQKRIIKIYKDLNGLEDATKKYYFSLSSSDKNYTIDINRETNDNLYNTVLRAFNIPIDKNIRCFVFKNWNKNYQSYQDIYFFNFDDFPNINKGIRYFSDTYELERLLPFINKFFENCYWLGNKFLSFNISSIREFLIYTTAYGSSWTCTEERLSSYSYYSNNKGCAVLPLSVDYGIKNNDEPESPTYYREFMETRTIKYQVYYLTLTPFFDLDVCCLAECFGITE